MIILNMISRKLFTWNIFKSTRILTDTKPTLILLFNILVLSVFEVPTLDFLLWNMFVFADKRLNGCYAISHWFYALEKQNLLCFIWEVGCFKQLLFI